MKMEASGAAFFSGHKICFWNAKDVEFPDVKYVVADQLAELASDTEC
jgi:hypothetical protein